MTKAGESILKGAREALDYAKGAREGYGVHIPAEVNVKAIRVNLGMTQEEFSLRFGFSLATLRQWEQGRRNPEGPARAYLTVIQNNPDMVLDALSA
jgi:putative transcriptional regulator